MRPGANAGEWVNYNDFIINAPGTYWIRVSVYTESGETIKSDAYYITVEAAADKTKPLIDPIKLSSTKITEHSELEISTAVSDNVGLKIIQLLINGEKVKEWSAKGTYTTISHTVSGYSVGSHAVKVIAIDQNGNQNSVETIFTVEKKQGGEIYSVEMSSYNFKAGTTITFTVTTSADTEKIRLRNGTWIFPNDITDSTTKNGKKVWVFEQYVETPGVNRVLNVETYSSGWTGKTMSVTFTVTPAENNIPSFDIDLAIVGFNGGSASWTVPVNVTPDRYVINIGGPNTYSAETTTNSITFGSSVFMLPGTYTISVTAQKDGYNPYTTSMTITLNCDHSNLKPISSRDTNEMYFDETYHMVNTETTYECQTCGGQITKTEQSQKIEHTHYVQLEQNGWVCSCGYANTGDYKSWTGYLQSDVNQPVYSTPKNFINANVIGTIFTDDIITVLGECGNTYFVRYSVTVGTNNQRTYSNGNTKSGYIPKSKVDSVEYIKGSVYDIYVDGQPVLSKLHDNNILYSDLDALLKSVKGVTSIKQNGNYEYVVSITHSVNSKNATFFVSFVDDAKTFSWSNVSVKLENGNMVDKEIIIGSFIYLDRIFIETNKFMEFLGYTIDDVYYNSADYKVDTKLYNAAENILSAGDSINEQYNEMLPTWASKAESVILRVLNLDFGDIVSGVDYKPNVEIVDTIEFMLMEGNYTEKQRTLTDSFIDALYDGVGVGLDVVEVTKVLKAVPNAKMSAALEKGFEIGGFVKNTGDLLISTVEIEGTEAVVLNSMLINYFDNIECLDNLIQNAKTSNNAQLVAIYEEVKTQLKSTYESNMLAFHKQYISDEKYRNEVTDTIVSFAVATGIAVAGGTVATVGAGLKLISLVLDSESYYESSTGIHRTVNAIELISPELQAALDNYYNNPSEDTLFVLVSYAYMMGDLKVKCMTYCVEFIDSDKNKEDGLCMMMGVIGWSVAWIGDVVELFDDNGADERKVQLENEKAFLIEQIQIVEVYK